MVWDRAVLFIFRAPLPRNPACRTACGAPECSERCKAERQRQWGWLGGVSAPTWGPPAEKNFGFQNAGRVKIRLSGGEEVEV